MMAKQVFAKLLLPQRSSLGCNWMFVQVQFEMFLVLSLGRFRHKNLVMVMKTSHLAWITSFGCHNTAGIVPSSPMVSHLQMSNVDLNKVFSGSQPRHLSVWYVAYSTATLNTLYHGTWLGHKTNKCSSKMFPTTLLSFNNKQ